MFIINSRWWVHGCLLYSSSNIPVHLKILLMACWGKNELILHNRPLLFPYNFPIQEITFLQQPCKTGKAGVINCVLLLKKLSRQGPCPKCLGST